MLKSVYNLKKQRQKKTTAVIAKQRLKMKNNAGYTKTTLDTRKQRFWAKSTQYFKLLRSEASLWWRIKASSYLFKNNRNIVCRSFWAYQPPPSKEKRKKSYLRPPWDAMKNAITLFFMKTASSRFIKSTRWASLKQNNNKPMTWAGRSREKLSPSAAINTLKQHFAVKRASPAMAYLRFLLIFKIAFSRYRVFTRFHCFHCTVKSR